MKIHESVPKLLYAHWQADRLALFISIEILQQYENV